MRERYLVTDWSAYLRTLLITLVPALPLVGAIVNGLLLQSRASRVVAGSIASLMVGLSAALVAQVIGPA